MSWFRRVKRSLRGCRFRISAGLLYRRLVIEWGSRYWSIGMPWELVHQYVEYLTPWGEWTRQEAFRHIQSEPYCYVLKSGEKQDRLAQIYVERRVWRHRWLQWTSCFQTVRQSIDVTFDDEVGERTGSWKGGTIGCGYEQKPGETATQTLRRMETERVFN